ncbi:MAG: DMT family transporter, partial [Pseudomonadota bacterium]
MPLIPLTALTMVAFAANSILNRLALADGSIGAVEFAALRVVSGALVLCLLVAVGSGWAALRLGDVQARLIPVGALSLYMFAFSLSYVVLEAGVGALILFGGVQVTMFAAAVIAREPVPLWRWVGSALALCGLAWILWPSGASAPPLFWSGLMAAAAFGWGIYSLWGRSAGPPLPATAANFALAVPIAVALFALLVGPAFVISPKGAVLAVLSGA